jgi:DNA-binding CsgD family transcriptional regulator/energy-coupling factor transporter ATP-binding protein EcfA2
MLRVADTVRMRLLEREAAQETLTTCAAEARAGHGRVVLVTGEAGVGKSSLVEWLAGQVPDARCSLGACDGLFTPRPLGPLYDLADQLGGPVRELCRAGADREELFQALLTRLRDPGTVDVVVIEDVHWADEATLDLLRFLARRIAGGPVLLVVTYRDDALGADAPLRMALGDIAGHRSTRRLGLAPLSVEAVRQLAVGSGLDEVTLYELTGGNPFFVTEVLCSGVAEVPALARDVVLARAARLGGTARSVLDAAALIGARVDPRLLRAVTDAPAAAVDEVLLCGLLGGDGQWLTFRHELARLAVQQAVAPHRARDLHARVLDELGRAGCEDDARLAFHAEAAGDAVAVLRHASAAARRAARMAAHREAAAQYERALRFAGDVELPQVAALCDELSEHLVILDRLPQAVEACERAVALWRRLGLPRREGQTLQRLSQVAYDLCRGPEVIAVAERAVAILRPLGPTEELARAHAAVARLYMLHGHAGAAVHAAGRAQRVAAPLGALDVVSDALISEACGVRQQGGDWTTPMGRALEIALANRLPAQVGRAYCNLSGGHAAVGGFALAEQYYRDGVAYCEQRDLDTYTTFLHGEHANVLLHTGQWEASKSLSTDLLREAGRSPINRLCALIRLGAVCARRGEPGAWQYLDEAAAIIDIRAEAALTVTARLVRAEAYWLQGSAAPARHEAELADDACAHCDAWQRGAVATWLRRTGSQRPARGPLAEPYRLALDDDRPGEAAAAWTALGCPYDAALVLTDAADERSLTEALPILHGLAAVPAARIVRQRLRRLGVRNLPAGPRSATRADPFGLTRREREVLDLIRAEHTNAEIAAKLFLSVRTVDHHVSAVLTKLGAPTRTAAAELAGRFPQ